MKLILTTATAALLSVAALSAHASVQLDLGNHTSFAMSDSAKTDGGTRGEGFIYGGFGPHNDSR